MVRTNSSKIYFKIASGGRDPAVVLEEIAKKYVLPTGMLLNDDVILNCIVFGRHPDEVIQELYGSRVDVALKKAGRKKRSAGGQYPIMHYCKTCERVFQTPLLFERHSCQEPEQKPDSRCPFCGSLGYEGKCQECGWKDGEENAKRN